VSEHLIEAVIATVAREVGPVNLFARIAIERAVQTAIDDAAWDTAVWFDGEAVATGDAANEP
jgi:hypothetical protein